MYVSPPSLSPSSSSLSAVLFRMVVCIVSIYKCGVVFLRTGNVLWFSSDMVHTFFNSHISLTVPGSTIHIMVLH